MCGINGSVPDSARIAQMNEALAHRGPDGRGEYRSSKLSLGHTRLSILDLTENAAQPMGLFPDGSLGQRNLDDAEYIIVFNGEIYNYKELREELGLKAIETTGDTGVILHAYKKWGHRCVKRFNGMWAFCIYDCKKNKLFLSRDRLGQKPLYYYNDKERFLFSSELKGIIAGLGRQPLPDTEAIGMYFSLGFIPAPRSIFTEIKKLPQGHNLLFDISSKKFRLKQYYEIPDSQPINDREKLISEGQSLLHDAVKIRLRADVPIGAFLSGGLDSSSLVGVLREQEPNQEIHTYSVGFRGKEYDESKFIRAVAKEYGTTHHHSYFAKNDFERLLDAFSETYDEPFWDYSGFPLMALSEEARSELKVVLTGDGGDEIFGGYNSHQAGARLRLLASLPKPVRWLLTKMPVRKNLNTFSSFYLLKQAARLTFQPPECFHTKALPDRYFSKEARHWSEGNLKYCLDKANGDIADALRIYDLLFNTLADNFLVKTDRATMRSGLEARSPFLDHRFIAFSQRIPSQWKANARQTKDIMRDIVEPWVPSMVRRRGKQGFEPPLDRWIMAEEKNLHSMLQELDEKRLIPEEIVQFYRQKVFISKDKLHRIHRIRLFLFYRWCARWILS